jgi:HSF-type DNA-binding
MMSRKTPLGTLPPRAASSPKPHLPAFLNKLYRMVSAPESDPWVFWNDEGTTFVIPDSQALAAHVLGHHFKHNNFPSFVRQLNMYGFHKVPHLNHGVLHHDGSPEVWEFINPQFRRDAPEEMRHIVRKKGEAERARSAAKHHPNQITPPSSPSQPPPRTLEMSDGLRADLQTIALRQRLIKEELFRLTASTEGLWKWALETRLRNDQQQARIDRIVAILSEAVRQRTSASSSSEVPAKIRGYLEAPSPPQTYEELSAPASREQTPPLSPPPQPDITRMFANGKVPVGFHDALQNYMYITQANLPSQPPATTPQKQPSQVILPDQFSPPPPPIAPQPADIQDWPSQTTPHVNLADYLADANIHIPDPQVTLSPQDPPSVTFPAETTGQPQPWLTSFLDAEQSLDMSLRPAVLETQNMRFGQPDERVLKKRRL